MNACTKGAPAIMKVLARHVIEHDVRAHADILDIGRRWILLRLNQPLPGSSMKR